MNLRNIGFLLTTMASLASSPVIAESASASGHAIYQNRVLTIPLVDTPEKSGAFQNVTLEFTGQGGWQLRDYKVNDTFPPYVEKVEVIVTDSFPVQVLLRVNGLLASSCSVLENISQRFSGNRFELIMSAKMTIKQPEEICTADVVRFEKVIPLSVYGLTAGTYEYSLGGVLDANTGQPQAKTFTGTFELARDNILTIRDDATAQSPGSAR